MSTRNLGEPFYQLANSYLYSADLLVAQLNQELPQSGGQWHLPAAFLYSHAAELLLKSFLRLHQYSVEQLGKKFGHDLDKLYAASVSSGLTIINFDKILPLLKAGHSEYQYRYTEKSFVTADLSWLGPEVWRLAVAVEDAVALDRQAMVQEARQNNLVIGDCPGKIAIVSFK